MRFRRLALVVTVALLLPVMVSFMPIMWPRTGAPERADAVVVLSGDHGERLPLALDLIQRGVTSVLVFDGALDSTRAVELCRGGQPFEVICLQPEVDNTRGEARAAADLASRRGWTRLVVATSTHHVARSRLLFRRCVRGEVAMIGAPKAGTGRVADGARQVLAEWLKLAYSRAFARDC